MEETVSVCPRREEQGFTELVLQLCLVCVYPGDHCQACYGSQSERFESTELGAPPAGNCLPAAGPPMTLCPWTT